MDGHVLDHGLSLLTVEGIAIARLTCTQWKSAADAAARERAQRLESCVSQSRPFHAELSDAAWRLPSHDDVVPGALRICLQVESKLAKCILQQKVSPLSCCTGHVNHSTTTRSQTCRAASARHSRRSPPTKSLITSTSREATNTGRREWSRWAVTIVSDTVRGGSLQQSSAAGPTWRVA